MKIRMWKSITAMLLALSLIISFSACSDGGSEEETTTEKETTAYDASGLVQEPEKNIVEVETLNMTVSVPDEGIQISANTQYFTTSDLVYADFKGEYSRSKFRTYSGHENNLPDILIPVSSDLYVAGSLPVFYMGSIDDAGIKAEQIPSDKGSGYVAFDLFVKADSDMKVYWDETTIECSDNPEHLSSLRVALVNCGVVAQNSEASDILAIKPDNALQNRVVMYEPEAAKHIESSGYTDGEAVPDLYIYSAFSGCTPSGNENNIVQEAQYAHAAYGTRATDVNKAENAYFNAAAGINRVRVYLWIEGNDVDCINEVSAALLDLDLVLTVF